MIGQIKIEGELKTQTVNGVANIVSQAHWFIETVRSNYTLKIHGGVCDFNYNPANPFIEYASLDEATVVGWVTSTMTAAESEYWNTLETKELEYLDDDERRGAATAIECFGEYKPTPATQAAPWAVFKPGT
ncbi:MAG: hypothetical protein ACPHNW_15410 [Pseudoalteromonas tetraodonis]